MTDSEFYKTQILWNWKLAGGIDGFAFNLNVYKKHELTKSENNLLL
jgi:hypothetical protein